MNYMFRNKTILSLICMILLSGCGYKESNTQIRDIGYLKFTKSISENYTVVVNEKYKFVLNSCVPNTETGQCYDDTVNKLYEISSGNTIIKAYDSNNNLLLRQEVYIGSNNTVEIALP